jgi:hypothetical protein
MTRVAGLLGISGALAAIIAWEIAGAPQADIKPPPQRPIAAVSQAPTPDADRTREWIATVLARPLFSPDRRPAADTASVAGTALPGLPRLTGILVGPFGRNAIFAANGRRPIVVQEGARIDAYTVRSIEAAQVRIVGPEGMRVLYPTFEAGSDKAASGPLAPRAGQAAAPR